MTKYATDHAGALADVREAGTAIVFEQTTFGAQDEEGRFEEGPVVVRTPAVCTEDGGDAEEYERLGLTPSESPRLFVVCEQYGAIPPLNSKARFGMGKVYNVQSVKPYRPDGTAIFSYVILSR